MGTIKATKTVKIELALIDDIQKVLSDSNTVLKNADNAWRSYQDYLTRADVPFKKMISAYNSVSNVEADSISISNKVESQAKELGISPSQIKGYDALNKNVITAKEIVSTIASFKDPSSFQ